MMPCSARTLHAETVDALLHGHIARIAKACDWEFLREVARLAASDAPSDLAASDPALFKARRDAVTRSHLAGWTNMTPDRVDEIAEDIIRRPRETIE